MLTIIVVAGLTIDWKQPPKVHGNTISGSAIVSNQTGHSLDLTVIVVAVNGIETTALTVQVLWGCRVYNTTPGETPQRVVADLFEQLSQGGTVTVHIEDADGKEHTLDASV